MHCNNCKSDFTVSSTSQLPINHCPFCSYPVGCNLANYNDLLGDNIEVNESSKYRQISILEDAKDAYFASFEPEFGYEHFN